MSDTTSLGAILRPATNSSLLDRMRPPPSPLSENQNLVDQTISSSLSEAAKGSTLLAMLGAGAVSRLTRAGVMSLALGEGTLLPLMARGGSYAIALANESATFAGIERGFHSVPSGTEFHPSQTSFEKDWARAFINLGSLKLLGTAAEGQNLLLQHLLTDLGMVGGQQVGAKFGLVEKPQGSLAQQMVQAEALNWSQKGGMALLHGLSPNLLSMEKSLDLYLRSRESDLFSKGRPALPFFSQLAAEGPGGMGVRTRVPDSGPSRENIVFAEGHEEGGAGTSGGFPMPEQVSREIGKLHRNWVDGNGEIELGGKKVKPADVDLDALQVALWNQKRPIIAGDNPLLSTLWGRLVPIFRNLNNPAELYKRELGHANYLLGLSIVLGRPLDQVTLPKDVKVEIPQYPMTPYELAWLRHQLTSSREGLALRRPEIVVRFFGGNEVTADAVLRQVLDEASRQRRGWETVTLPAPSVVTTRANLDTQPARRITLFDLSLNDVSHIIPPDEGGPPLSNLALSEAVWKGGFESLLQEGNCIGWWTRLSKKGAYQANILGRIPEFNPDAVYGLLSHRERWPEFYPGFYLVEQVRPLTSEQGIFRLAIKTPAGKLRMHTKHTIIPDQFQVRWEDPSPEHLRGLELGTEPDEQVVARIQGSITSAQSPSGPGSLVLYELFMTARQTGAGGSIDPFADLQRGQHATMARVPPLLTSIYAKLAAIRDGGDWGIISDPEKLAEYRNSRDVLKGPEPAGVHYQPRVFVIEK